VKEQDRFRQDLGAFVLGALDPGEAGALREHLDGCAGCRRELAELQSVAPMVARARQRRGLFGNLGSKAAGSRLSRWRVIAAVSVTAMVAASVAGVMLSATAPTVAFHSTTTWIHAQGSVTYQPRSWGTQLLIRVSGLPNSLRCQIWVESDGGGWQEAGSWRPVSGGATAVEAASVLPLTQIAGVALETPQGKELLWAAAPGSDG
jgi:hypothetical protein